MDRQISKNPSPHGQSSIPWAIGLLAACLATTSIVFGRGGIDVPVVEDAEIRIVPYPPPVTPPHSAFGTPTIVTIEPDQAEEVAQDPVKQIDPLPSIPMQ